MKNRKKSGSPADPMIPTFLFHPAAHVLHTTQQRYGYRCHHANGHHIGDPPLDRHSLVLVADRALRLRPVPCRLAVACALRGSSVVIRVHLHLQIQIHGQARLSHLAAQIFPHAGRIGFRRMIGLFHSKLLHIHIECVISLLRPPKEYARHPRRSQWHRHSSRPCHRP